MRSEMIPTNTVERLSQVLQDVMVKKLGRHLGANQRAAAAWFGANGDRERAHTTRVFLRSARLAGADPIICVRVDSHAFLTDLSANRDLYLSRLANWGFFVSGIDFAVDREARHPCGAAQGPPLAQVGAPSRDGLSAEQGARLDELIAKVPAQLRPSISKAIIASMGNEGTQ